MNTLLGLNPNQPDQFLHILWSAQFRFGFPPETYHRFWQRDLDAISYRAPFFLGAIADEDKANHSVAMIADIATGKGDGGADSYFIPRAWLRVFDDLHKAGFINAVVHGRAVRFIYTGSDAGFGSLDHNAYCLDVIRRAEPAGLMYPHEREFLDNLPDVVPLYRGSFVSALEDGVRGLSWTNNPHLADGYSRLRRTIANRSTHRTLLLEAQVPKEAILAVILSPTPTYEVLVDYEALPASAATETALTGWGIALPEFANV